MLGRLRLMELPHLADSRTWQIVGVATLCLVGDRVSGVGVGVGVNILDRGGAPNWCVNSAIAVLGSGWTCVGKLRRVDGGIDGGTGIGWPTSGLVA